MASRPAAFSILLAVAVSSRRQADFVGKKLRINEGFEMQLLEDALPPSSDKCGGDGDTTEFTSSFTPSSSGWDTMAADFENKVFLAEMRHTDADVNRSWSIRIGDGGNIYSYVSAFGEAMPPQRHVNGIWVDEVWQQIAVARPTGEGVLFVHQAGPYQNQNAALGPLPNNPWFSPSLAKHCSDNTCTFASWGQVSAGRSEERRSGIIYYARYRDCGDGIMEATWMMHNIARESPLPSDSVDYINVPWGGVRRSTLKSMLLPPAPVITSDFPLPCGKKTGSGSVLDCSSGGAEPLQLTLMNIPRGNNEPCQLNGNGQWIQCMLKPGGVLIKTGSTPDTPLYFVGSRGAVRVQRVLYWAWATRWVFFKSTDPTNQETLDEINSKFVAGDTIQLSGMAPGAATVEAGPAVLEDLQAWGDEHFKLLSDVGGYTTFAQNLEPATPGVSLPCGQKTGPGSELDCSTEGAEPLQLTVMNIPGGNNPPCKLSGQWIQCMLKPGGVLIKTGTPPDSPFDFVGSRGTVSVERVLYWAWATRWLFFKSTDPTNQATLDQINSKFVAGDTIQISNGGSGLPQGEENNLALSFVHGSTTTSGATRARIRYGTTQRDYTGWTVNVEGIDMSPGNSYWSRQYIVAGRYADSDARSHLWVGDAADRLLVPSSGSAGRIVKLFNVAGGVTAVVGQAATQLCGTESVCSGQTSPESGLPALFSVQCGDHSYIGHDPSTAGETIDPSAPWKCAVGAAWRLLGYFARDACNAASGMKYSVDACAE